MINDNVANNIKSENMSEPTLADVLNKLGDIASKSDMEDLKNRIDTYTIETNKRMNNMSTEIQNVATTSSRNAEKIQNLQTSVEILKQNQLQNNIVISGVPSEICSTTTTNDIVIKIAAKLSVQIVTSHLSSYTIANNKFIIAKFFNYHHKQTIINNIRTKKSLMVEEVFDSTSNSQIYVNDHLTQHFNKLYLLARTAKKDGKIAFASSSGGKIRIKKRITDTPTLITTQNELEEIINTNTDLNSTTDSVQLVNEVMNASTSTNSTTTTTTTLDTSASTSRGRSTNIQNQNKDTKVNKKRRAHSAVDLNRRKKTK